MKKTNFTLLPSHFKWSVSTLLLLFYGLSGMLNQAEAQSSCVLSCTSYTQVSLDEFCEAEITWDMILTTDSSCPDWEMLSVEVSYQGVVIPTSPMVDESWVGYTLTAKVKESGSNNSCWGTIYIEDKLPPVIEPCGETIQMYCYDVADYVPFAEDACDGEVNPTLISETFFWS